MARFAFEVVLDVDTFEHAEQVMAERLEYDEQYEDEEGVEFDYQFISWYVKGSRGGTCD